MDVGSRNPLLMRHANRSVHRAIPNGTGEHKIIQR